MFSLSPSWISSADISSDTEWSTAGTCPVVDSCSPESLFASRYFYSPCPVCTCRGNAPENLKHTELFSLAGISMKNDVKVIASNGLAAYNAVPSLHILLVLHLRTGIVSRSASFPISPLLCCNTLVLRFRKSRCWSMYDSLRASFSLIRIAWNVVNMLNVLDASRYWQPTRGFREIKLYIDLLWLKHYLSWWSGEGIWSHSIPEFVIAASGATCALVYLIKLMQYHLSVYNNYFIIYRAAQS